MKLTHLRDCSRAAPARIPKTCHKTKSQIQISNQKAAVELFNSSFQSSQKPKSSQKNQPRPEAKGKPGQTSPEVPLFI
jgi:hypothetical protein